MIVGQNFVLMYPIMFLSFFIMLMVNQTQGEAPSLESKWVLLAVCILLLNIACYAGWFSMIVSAVRDHCIQITALINHPETPEQASQDADNRPDPFLTPFKHFTAFIPGVGQFFNGFMVGYGLQILFLLFLCLIGYLVVEYTSGFPDHLEKLFDVYHPEEVRKYLLKANPAQLKKFEVLNLALLGIMLLNALFSLLTYLWPAFMVVHRVGPFKAYGKSMAQFVRDPFLLTFLMFLFIASFLSMSAASQTSNFILSIMMDFCRVILMTFSSVLTVLYVFQLGEVPDPILDIEDEPNANA